MVEKFVKVNVVIYIVYIDVFVKGNCYFEVMEVF